MEPQKSMFAQVMGTYIMPLSAAPRNLQMEVIMKFFSLRLTAWLLALCRRFFCAICTYVSGGCTLASENAP